jgi:hypothetical protein
MIDYTVSREKEREHAHTTPLLLDAARMIFSICIRRASFFDKTAVVAVTFAVSVDIV